MGAKGQPKTGGRKKGSLNKFTAEVREQAMATGKTALQVMMENMRWADDQVQSLLEQLPKAVSAEQMKELIGNIMMFRSASQAFARQVAPFFHPTLQAIAHDHTSADGSIVRPIIEITGYPTELPTQAAPAPKAVASPGDTRH